MKFGFGSESRNQAHDSGRDALFVDRAATNTRKIVDPEEILQSKFDQCFDQAAEDFLQFDAFDGFDDVEFVDDRA